MYFSKNGPQIHKEGPCLMRHLVLGKFHISQMFGLCDLPNANFGLCSLNLRKKSAKICLFLEPIQNHVSARFAHLEVTYLKALLYIQCSNHIRGIIKYNLTNCRNLTCKTTAEFTERETIITQHFRKSPQFQIGKRWEHMLNGLTKVLK